MKCSLVKTEGYFIEFLCTFYNLYYFIHVSVKMPSASALFSSDIPIGEKFTFIKLFSYI